jgi:hypothetical protein
MRVDALDRCNKLGWLDIEVRKWRAVDRHRAGEKLREDYFNAGFEMTTIDPSKIRVDCQGFKTPSEARRNAEERYFRALKYIPKEFASVVRRVVIENKVFEGNQLEKYALKIDLVRGLDYLCDFYSSNRRPKS